MFVLQNEPIADDLIRKFDLIFVYFETNGVAIV